MTMKHTAALFYYEKNYPESARLYKELLGLVPKENACVTRELKDALARSLVKIGEAETALKKVEELVSVKWMTKCRLFVFSMGVLLFKHV